MSFTLSLILAALAVVVINLPASAHSRLVIERRALQTSSEGLSGESNSVPIASLAFSPDGRRLIVGCRSDRITILEKNSAMRLNLLSDQILKHDDKYYGSKAHRYRGRYNGNGVAVALSHDGQAIAYQNSFGGVSLGLLGTDKFLGFLQSYSAAQSIKFSPDLKTLAILWSNGRLDLLTVKGENLHSLDVGGFLQRNCIAFSPDGSQIVVVGGWEGFLIDVATGTKSTLPVYGSGQLRSLAFSPDGKFLACGSVDGAVVICDARSWQECYRFKTKFKSLSALAFSPDSKQLAIGDEAMGLRLWKVGSHIEPRLVTSLKRSPAFSLAFTPDGRFLAMGGNDCEIKFLNLNRKKVCASLYLSKGDQWAAVDDAGHFDCSQYGRVFLQARIKKRYVDLDSVGDSAFRPGLLAKLVKIEI